jgi:hypothetical protein
MRAASSSRLSATAGVSTLRYTIPKKTSIWLTQLAWVGVRTRIRLG